MNTLRSRWKALWDTFLTTCKQRTKYIVAGLIVFFLELALFIWPVGWLGDDITHFLAGQGAWILENTAESGGYCQAFQPTHRNLAELGIVINHNGEAPEEGAMSFVISDAKDNILFSKEIPYSDISWNAFNNIKVDLQLTPGKIHYLTVNFTEDEAGRIPSLSVCSTEYLLKENVSLIHETPLEDVQLITWYTYTNAIAQDQLIKIIGLSILTALAIAFGLPKSPWIRNGIGVLLALMGPYLLGSRLDLLTVDTQFYLPQARNWNIGIMYFLELVVFLCTHSLKWSICITNLFLTVLYSANYFVFTFRGTPLYFNEISAAKTAFNVLGGYRLRPNSHLAMGWALALFLIAWGFCVGMQKKKEHRKVRLIGNGVSFCLGIAVLFLGGNALLNTDLLERQGFKTFTAFEKHMNYHFNGYLVASCIDIQASRIQPPAGYSKELVEEILEQKQSTEVFQKAEAPHVILILNESFSDLRVLGNLQLSQENMSFFNSLTENTIRGYLNASVIGGGTANSEFEVFTGCTAGFLPSGYYPYQQSIDEAFPSLVSLLGDFGYTTHAMHPEAKSNWNRANVYRHLGFDFTYWKEDFAGAETLHNGVTDLETYKKVMEIFEARDENERLFIFDLTMQNHGDYMTTDVVPDVTALNASTSEANTFLSLMKASDRDFKALIDYFAKEEEKVILCMYGDHQPQFSDLSFYESIYAQTEGLTEYDKKMNQYKVPFVIWANYDIPEQADLDLGMNYLAPLLLETADIPASPFMNFVNEVRQSYPIVSVNGYVDSEGTPYTWEQADDLMKLYQMLQYNYLFD